MQAILKRGRMLNSEEHGQLLQNDIDVNHFTHPKPQKLGMTRTMQPHRLRAHNCILFPGSSRIMNQDEYASAAIHRIMRPSSSNEGVPGE
jgi:hypothetical protein